MLGKVAWCSDWLGQWRIKQVFIDVICLWPAGRNLGGIHASLIFDYLSISIEGKRPSRIILENHGCKFTHSWEMAVKPTCVCVCVFLIEKFVNIVCIILEGYLLGPCLWHCRGYAIVTRVFILNGSACCLAIELISVCVLCAIAVACCAPECVYADSRVMARPTSMTRVSMQIMVNRRRPLVA
jgi:hypothetical protein